MANSSGDWGAEDEEDDAFDEDGSAPQVRLRAPARRLERAPSGRYGFSSPEDEAADAVKSVSPLTSEESEPPPMRKGIRRGGRRRVSVYEGFKGHVAAEQDPGGHEDAAGEWIPEEDEEEADSDDEWADTGETRRSAGAAAGAGVVDALETLSLGVEDEDLLLTDRDQVLLFGDGLTASTCTKSGWVRKANGFSKLSAQHSRSKLRWFELHTDTLFYYRQVPPDYGRDQPLGFLTISHDVNIESVKGREIAIITPKRPYHLFFDSVAEHAAWLHVIVEAAQGAPEAEDS